MKRHSHPAIAPRSHSLRFVRNAHSNRASFSVARPHSEPAIRRLLYVIELDPNVALDSAFKSANPNHVSGMPSFYVGSTSLTPQERFDQHTSGRKNASRIAYRYGRKLRMDLVPSQGNKLPRAWALKAEARLARELRAQGYGVWQA